MINQGKMIRIATVKATGDKYIVTNCSCVYNPDKTLNVDLSKVHCWGELSAFRNLSSKHDGTKTFLERAVTITDVEKTVPLMKELFEQGLRALQAKGFIIGRTRKGNAKIYGHV